MGASSLGSTMCRNAPRRPFQVCRLNAASPMRSLYFGSPLGCELIADLAEVELLDVVAVDQADRHQLRQHFVDRKRPLVFGLPDPQAARRARVDYPQLHRRGQSVEHEDAQAQRAALRRSIDHGTQVVRRLGGDIGRHAVDHPHHGAPRVGDELRRAGKVKLAPPALEQQPGVEVERFAQWARPLRQVLSCAHACHPGISVARVVVELDPQAVMPQRVDDRWRERVVRIERAEADDVERLRMLRQPVRDTAGDRRRVDVGPDRAVRVLFPLHEVQHARVGVRTVEARIDRRQQRVRRFVGVAFANQEEPELVSGHQPCGQGVHQPGEAAEQNSLSRIVAERRNRVRQRRCVGVNFSAQGGRAGMPYLGWIKGPQLGLDPVLGRLSAATTMIGGIGRQTSSRAGADRAGLGDTRVGGGARGPGVQAADRGAKR